ncbi:MAG: hypothetical protein VKK03_08290 [Synechococcus sp.]|nr:hypothetical protein [Synechococcus sp.]
MHSLKRVLSLIALLAPCALVPLDSNDVKAGDFTRCSFNYQIIACKLDRVNGGIRITWIDGKRMTYYGKLRNSAFLQDTLGGSWRYLDFSMGRAFSLKNPANGNVIIWNGTFKNYGGYVGL